MTFYNKITTYREIDKIENNVSIDHFHYINEIIMCNKGSATFIINNEEIILNQGDLILINGFENHSVRINNFPYDRYVTLFSSDFLSKYTNNPFLISMLSSRRKDLKHIFKIDKEIYKSFKNIFKELELEQKNKDTFWQETSAYMISKILITLTRNDETLSKMQSQYGYDNQISKLQLYINENYYKDINLKELSNSFYTSISTISRKFKDYTGFSIKNYIIITRMQKAKSLLLFSDKDIQEISNEVGYENPSHFSRIFKKYNDINPLKYRKIARKQLNKDTE